MVQAESWMMRPLRIAFPIVDSRVWLGGFNYQLNLVRSLSAHVPDRVKPLVFFGDEIPSEDVAPFAGLSGVTVICDKAFSAAERGTGLLAALVTGLDRNAARLFADHKVDLVFESARFFGGKLPQAAIAFFPDFQHRRLPHMFGLFARWRRELGFRVQLRSGRTILVSSEDARQACENYYPRYRQQVRVLRFPASVALNDMDMNPSAVRERHGLRDRFVFLPNQFWSHKNHAVVIEALGLLKQKGEEVCVVSTGSVKDPRSPGLFDGLMRRAGELGVTDMFRVLGRVSRSEVIALLRSCDALLNPSESEGWSSSVEEAKLFDVPMILSDLPVHREQAGSGAEYFAAADAVALSKLLSNVVRRRKEGGEVARSPRDDMDVSSKSFAEAFSRISIECFNGRRETLKGAGPWSE